MIKNLLSDYQKLIQIIEVNNVFISGLKLELCSKISVYRLWKNYDFRKDTEKNEQMYVGERGIVYTKEKV